MVKTVGYVRVSGLGQEKGDGILRQTQAIETYSIGHNLHCERFFSDIGVSGTLYERKGLTDLLEHISSNPDISTILVESSDRLARKILVQELLIQQCQELGIQVISTKEGDLTESKDETRILQRQIYGVFSEYEKNRLVRRLRTARKRIRQEKGKCEGRPGYLDNNPQLVSEVKKLYRKPKKAPRRSYREIADILNSKGYKTIQGKTITSHTVGNILYSLRNN
ncbi:MAG: recombinase family protein [Desulfarculus sp.]|nr:recombinase family protein [Pseudomonadota bacterium]MBV1738890.1 recombinase family protein [Desulfarculus sp.]